LIRWGNRDEDTFHPLFAVTLCEMNGTEQQRDERIALTPTALTEHALGVFGVRRHFLTQRSGRVGLIDSFLK
jgi:hypothetical protein